MASRGSRFWTLFVNFFVSTFLRFWMRLLLGWLTFGNFDFAVWVRSLVGIFGELATFGPVSPTSSLTEYEGGY